MRTCPTSAQRLAISLLPALTGVAIPFVHFYLLNKGNLKLPFSVHLSWLALLAAIVFGLCFGIQRLVPAVIRPVASGVILALGVFTWAESTLLVGDFGFFEGKGIEWSRWRHLLYLELLLAGALTFAFYRLRSRVFDRAALIVCLLTLSAIANLYPAWRAQHGVVRDIGAHTFTQSGVMDLSPDRNVLIFVIDTYQSDLFAEIVARTPGWRARLDGFTYFPNATCAFPKTYASVPDMLTGKTFDNTQPFRRYLYEAYFGNSVPRVLKESGFDSRILAFTWQPYLADPALADNLAEIGSRAGRAWMQGLEFITLVNLTIFRISPFLAKPWAYNDSEFRIRQTALGPKPVEIGYELSDDQRQLSAGNRFEDLEFHDLMMAHLGTGMEQPAFRLFHFRGVHAPLTVDRNLNVVADRPLTRKNVRDQAEGMLKMLVRQFDRLRQLGVYENSTIIVIGDHGAGGYPSVGVDESALEDLDLEVPPFSDDPSIGLRLVQGGIPLVLIKPAGASGRLGISTAPVELADVPNTVFADLGLDDARDGPSMFAIPEQEERVRIHRYYGFTGWGQDFIVPMTEYEISGFSWDQAAWSPTGRDLNQNALDSVEGTLVILGEGGNLDDFTHSGWPEPIGQGRWLKGQDVELRIPLEPAAGSRLLEVRALTLARRENPLRLEVGVNGETIDEFSISRRSAPTISTWIPASICDDARAIEVTLSVKRSGDDAESLRLIEVRVGPASE